MTSGDFWRQSIDKAVKLGYETCRERSPLAINLRINQKEWRSPEGHEPGRRPPKGISYEHHRAARKRAGCGPLKKAEAAGFRSRRYAPRQRQSGRRRAYPRAGL